MSIRGFIIWSIACMLGMVALSSMAGSEAPVISLENGLGAEVEITRL